MADTRLGRASETLPEDAQRILDWLQRRRGDGRPRVFSPVEIARGVFPKLEGPTPGVLFDPAAWPRVNRALELLEARGLVEKGWLPQGDAGYRLPARE